MKSLQSAPPAVAPPTSKPRLGFERNFANPGRSSFDEIEWERRTVEITDDSGKAMFRQENAEVPKNWSVLAMKIAVSQYFYGNASLGDDPSADSRMRRTMPDTRMSLTHRFEIAGHEGYITGADQTIPVTFDPDHFCQTPPKVLERPLFLAIVSSPMLCRTRRTLSGKGRRSIAGGRFLLPLQLAWRLHRPRPSAPGWGRRAATHHP
ncbi:MAG: hypothetical protein WEB53_08845, partial [Akkermansiaceae bacterium]